ncbi:hypothetical protein M5D96_004710 [Drosophila gunungcola]|uniref:Uncharacterized protein n=1 Tax=Drosophila gunungcola TaxID=103775 RepID=A0A9P9YUY5_9MUSC|nr:hypothetical protein M5D96_004710 [Drosophila gunungcola]
MKSICHDIASLSIAGFNHFIIAIFAFYGRLIVSMRKITK